MRFDRVRLRGGADDPGAAAASDLTDSALVRAYQRDPAGQEGRQAAGMLLDRYRRRVLIWCRRIIRDDDAAEDLAQDVLLGALCGLDEYRDRGDFGAWLFMVTRNRCLSELRRRRVPIAEEAVLELIASNTPGPDQELEHKILGADLLKLLREALAPDEQDAIWLRCFEGLPLEVITRRLANDEMSGARSLLQRARRKLRRALALREEEGP